MRDRIDPPSPDSPAGDVVVRYVAEQVAQIIASDPLVRIDSPGSVHRMRVAVRRLRSALQTFRPVMRSTGIEALRSELRWLAAELGTVRDAEVMRERILTALEVDDAQQASASVGVATDAETTRAYRTAHEDLMRTLDAPRYQRVIIALQDLVRSPPLTAKAARPAHRVLPHRAARAYARLDALVTAAHRAATPAERDMQWHDARKAAKKARYAGEALTAFFGEPAARFAAAMEKLQEVLGEHQDSVVMRARLEELAREETGPVAFAYGRLHAHEETRGTLALKRFEVIWRKTRKKKLRSWFA